jgi:hypothetical protein
MLFFVICLSISSCILGGYPACPVSYFQPFETTVKVIDKNGQPVANREVFAINSTGGGNSGSIASAKTDNTGKAILKYQLSHNCEQTHYGIIVAKEDDSFQPVNAITHKNNEKDKVMDSIKLSGTIWMDSLVSFNLRIKSNKNNVDTLDIFIYANRGDNDTTIYIYRQFKRTIDFRVAALLDTIVSVKVYSKATFNVSNSLKCRDGSNIKGKTHVIDSKIDRNILFLDEIN